MTEPAGPTFDLNTFVLARRASRLNWSPWIRDGLLQPPKGFGRIYLDELRDHQLIRVDSVGGTALLVRADLHRDGLNFPPYPYQQLIETEAMAAMARDMGHACWALPNLEVVHPRTPEAPPPYPDRERSPRAHPAVPQNRPGRLLDGGCLGNVCGVLIRQIGCTNSVLIGVGNVYRAEVLFRHRLDPLQPGCQLRADQWAVLWSDLVELMNDGVRRGRIDTVQPEHDPILAGRAPRQDRHGGEVYVYRRAGALCLVCGTAVASTAHAGRNLYGCPRCQQRPVL